MVSSAAPVSVRVATDGDLSAVLSVYARSAVGSEPRPSASERERSTWDRMLEREGLALYLAEEQGRPVGTATLVTIPNLTYDCAPSAVIEAVVVVHDRRRKGIATAIMKRVLEDARAAGCNKVQLLSHKRHASDGAHRLYTSLGFEAEAEGFRLYLGAVPPAVQAARAVLPGARHE
ncbi:MAG: family N-acetyltransferase [Acidimicrobiaceae bacterium]|nr:family N-acetyltransferase [Acidimicrobiaceae bacterium]